MGLFWSMGSRRFMNAGVVEKLGGVDTLLEASKHYDLQNCSKYKNNAIMFDCFLANHLVTPLLLTFGRIPETLHWINHISDVIEEVRAKKRQNREVKVEYPSLELMQYPLLFVPVCIMFGMQTAATRVLEAWGWHSWNSEGLKDWWAVLGSSWGMMLGKENLYNVMNLIVFLLYGKDAAPLEQVRALITDSKVVSECDRRAFFCSGITKMVVIAGLAAEAIGDDSLADNLAEQGIKKLELYQHMACCALLALRGRIAEKRRKRGNAVEYWKAAATRAMAERLPLIALSVGLECKGAEGETMIENACQALGQSREDLLRELAKARAVP
eukprot:gnl/MRDRNA2_/MRDRNA2_133079_c0_seq1.p1 gnl/MRDRNA2_/MRDRNA2_133079_c0~~gnl/MRDRNA2_/MRDRNA2_133079_c0_seq1.p1  ORF type:complete len:327 (-),score=44.48 gnl/MRDRNA2_/MRDRNA2_133079_c0_seq1:111-1091(-)